MSKAESKLEKEEAEKLDLNYKKTCDCPDNHLSCISAKEWLKCQLGVWQFYYEGRDVRDKKAHPATFPIALPKKVIKLFTHKGELVLDPFVGSGTTLVAARNLDRNAAGFDLNKDYISLAKERLCQEDLFSKSRQLAICEGAINIPKYIEKETVSLIITSPPYANLLNRRRKNKSRRTDQRNNDQYMEIEQYSQHPRDLGTMEQDEYSKELKKIFAHLLPLLNPKAHCVINIPDMWWANQRVTLHISVVDALGEAGYELRNTIIWDRTNIVNKVGIFEGRDFWLAFQLHNYGNYLRVLT